MAEDLDYGARQWGPDGHPGDGSRAEVHSERNQEARLKTISKRAQLLGVMKRSFAKLTEAQRQKIGANLGLTPHFNIVFVEGMDGQPEGENDA
jgi:hypothetical protein